MPSKSDKQHKFMAAVAHNPEFARTVGVSPTVGKHFMDADRRSKKWASKMRKKKRKAVRKLDGLDWDDE